VPERALYREAGMSRPIVTVMLAAALVLGVVSAAEGTRREAEGCQAFNPVQPTCSYTATHPGDSPVSGIAGVGDWVVKTKLGKTKETYKSPASGEPTVVEMVIPPKTKVSVSTTSPGSGVIVGHAD
jgi:hypothetical protein